MSRQLIGRLSVVLVAAAAVAATSAGVTYATTAATSRVVYACADAHGTLTLLAKGRCAQHTSKVAIDKQGPIGKTGKTGLAGKQGKQGPTGPQGPGALTASVSGSSPSSESGQTTAIPGLNLSMNVDCLTGSFAKFKLFDPTSVAPTYAGAPFTLGGSTIFANGTANTAKAISYTEAENLPTGAAAGRFNVGQHPGEGVLVSITTGDLDVEWIVRRVIVSGSASYEAYFNLHVFLSIGAGCAAQAVETPTN